MFHAFINWFKGLFIEKPKKLVTIVKEAVVMPETRNMKCLKMAASQIGVKEISGPKSNPVVEEYLDYGFKGNKSGLTDDIPWCAGFVCWVVEKVGMQSTNSLMARSFEHWGLESTLDPLPGDIIVFWRDSLSSGKGHVGFFLGHCGKRRAFVIGGNQRDSVSIGTYSLNRLRTIRRTSKNYQLTKAQRYELYKMRDKIMKDNKMSAPGGSVV